MTTRPKTNTTDATTVDSIAPLALRAPEAARAIGISERALWSRTVTGEIPHVKLGRTTVYPVDALRAWLHEQARRSTRRPTRGREP